MGVIMNKYIAFYNGKQIEVEAETSYGAYKYAITQFKPPKSKQHMVHVHIVETEGKPVIHNTGSI
jgi:c-di-GMP-binding flagellar brake protein YcgR